MNRFSFLDLFKKPPYKRPPHTVMLAKFTVASMDNLIEVGREFYEDGYKDIYVVDTPETLHMGYLFHNRQTKAEVTISIHNTQGKYLSILNSEAGRIKFTKAFEGTLE